MTLVDSQGNVYETVFTPMGVIGQVLPQGGGQDATNALTVNQAATGLLELASLHATLLVGNSLIASGTGDDKDKQDPYYTVRRPWLDMPEGGVPFDPEEAVDLPNLVLPSGNTLVVSHTVPDGYDGVINAYSWNFLGGGFTEGSGDLVVQLLRDGVPIRNYDNITVEKGTIAEARAISPLRIYSKQTISLVINHVANPLLNGNVVGSLVGYDYPAMS
jgi:hypothetical protein